MAIFGPLFPELYKVLKKYRDQMITHLPHPQKTLLNQKQTQVIDYVVAKYGHRDTWDLIAKIHNEEPWFSTFPAEKLFSRKLISDEKIFKYYSQHQI
ncbi:MAG: DUF4065 domain-containing protein [Vigna little leaf phytoplasma]|nr:DUF4065 domain-containing protein [Vigna little leaf phytoplasma]